MSPAVLFLVGVVAVFTVAGVTGWIRWKWLLRQEELALERDAGVVTVTLTIDTRGVERAMRRASEATARFPGQLGAALLPAMQGLARGMARTVEEIQWRQYLDRQLTLARASAVIGTRAGLDPHYRTVEALRELVVTILSEHGRWWFLTDAERRELAVSAMHGWAHGWGKTLPREPAALVRSWGSATVTVVSA